MHLGGRSWEEELSYLTFNASANFRPHSASHLAAVLGARRDSDEKSTSTIRSSTSGTLKSVRGTTSQARHLGLSTQQPEKTTAFSSFTQPSLAGFESQSAADPALQSLLNSIIQQATALSTALPVGAQPTEASSKSTEPSSPTSTSVDPRFAPTGSSASQPNGQKRSLLPLIAIPGALLVFLAIFLGVWRRKRRARPRRVVQAEAPSPLSVRQEITIGDTISTRRSIFWRTTGGRPTAREMKEADTSDRASIHVEDGSAPSSAEAACEGMKTGNGGTEPLSSYRNSPYAFAPPVVSASNRLHSEQPLSAYTSSPATRPIIPALAQGRASTAARLQPGAATWLGDASGQEFLTPGQTTDPSLQAVSREPLGEGLGPSGHEPLVALALPYNIAERMLALLESHPVQRQGGGMGVEDLEAPPAYEQRSTGRESRGREQD